MRRAFWIALLLATGCKQRTELMIGVITELRAPDLMDEVRLDVETGDHESNLTPILLPGSDWTVGNGQVGTFVLPGSYGLNSSDGTEPSLQIKITGLKGGTAVVERSARVSMVGQKTLFMRMGLVVGCMGNFQCNAEAGQSCIEGRCQDSHVDPRTLPDFRAELVDHVTCNSGENFIDTSKCSDGNCMAVPSLGDMQCAGACVEGTCYNPVSDDGGSHGGGPIWVPQQLPASAGMSKLNAVWGTTSQGYDVFAVGDRGDGTGIALHLSGSAAPTQANAWADEPLPTGTLALTGVSGTSAGDVWAVGLGQILHRQNGAWAIAQTPQVPSDVQFEGVTFSSVGGFAVGKRTGDMGQLFLFGSSGQWTPSPLAQLTTSPPLVGISMNELGGAAVGFHGTLYGLGPDGTTGVTATGTDATGPNLNGVWVEPNSQRGIVVGDAGTILRAQFDASGSTLTTTPLSSPAKGSLWGVFGASPQNIYVGGDQGTILHSTDDGNSFVPEPSGTSQPIFSFWASGANDVYAVGPGAVLLHSAGGTQNPGADDAGVIAMHDGGNTQTPDFGTTTCNTWAVDTGPVVGMDTGNGNLFFASQGNTLGMIDNCGNMSPVVPMGLALSGLGRVVFMNGMLYFLSGGVVYRMPAGTGGPAQGASSDAGAVLDFAVDQAQNVYTAISTGIIKIAPGGASNTISTTAPKGQGIATDSSNVYWFTTGAPTQLVFASVNANNVAGTNIGSVNIARGLASGGNGVVWSDESLGNVNWWSGSTVPMAQGISAPAAITANPKSLYFGTFTGSNDTVQRVGFGTPLSPMPVANNLVSPSLLAADSTFIYIYASSRISKAPN